MSSTCLWHFYFSIKNHRILNIRKYMCFCGLLSSEAVRPLHSFAYICFHFSWNTNLHIWQPSCKLLFQVLGLNMRLVCQLVYSLFLISGFDLVLIINFQL